MSPSSTSSSKRGPWRLLFRVVAFALPLAIPLGIIEIQLWRVGESWSAERSLAYQRAHPDSRYARRYFSQQFNRYKLLGIRQHQPEILVVGSSRAMQFRSELFPGHERDFYNAGGILQGLADFEQLVALMHAGDVPVPRVLIITVDMWWFRQGDAGRATWLTDDGLTEAAYTLAGHVAAIRAIREKGFPSRADGSQVIGAGSGGFRPDGSRSEGPLVEECVRDPRFVDHEHPPIGERIRKGLMQFADTAGFDANDGETFTRALGALRAMGVETYVLFPPLSTEAANAIAARGGGLNDLWIEFNGRFANKVKQLASVAVILETPDDIGYTDEAMWDGFHPGAVLLTSVMERFVASAPAGSVMADISLKKLRELREDAVCPRALDNR